MEDPEDLQAKADKCRRLSEHVDPLTTRILQELADQCDAEARLLMAQPKDTERSG
jgi:hypothetical protein